MFIEQQLHFKYDLYTEYNICQTLHVKWFFDSKNQAVMPLIDTALILEKLYQFDKSELFSTI